MSLVLIFEIGASVKPNGDPSKILKPPDREPVVPNAATSMFDRAASNIGSKGSSAGFAPRASKIPA